MTRSDSAGVRLPPPIIYFLFLGAGLLLGSAWRDGHFAPLYLTVIGALLVIASALLLLTAAGKFRRAKTHLEPWKPTTRIVTDGIYQYSRNPIYLGMAIGYAGIAIAAASPIALILLLPCLIVIRYYVIRKEEAYLEHKFGSEYLDYKAKVRRWI